MSKIHGPIYQTPESARSQAYIFENGLQGDGLLGFQTTITNTNPEEKGYSPLYRLNPVKWKNDDGENIFRVLEGSVSSTYLANCS